MANYPVLFAVSLWLTLGTFTSPSLSARFNKQMLKQGATAYKGTQTRNYLLSGVVSMTALNQGINRYYRKDGGQQAMIRDFDVVQPSNVHINKVDGHVVGRTGIAGNLRIRYSLYDPLKPDSKPTLFINEIDNAGRVVARDIITYWG